MDSKIGQKTYSSKDFKFEKLLSNNIRMKIGHFETTKGNIYSFAYGHPDRNDDYFEYVQITPSEYKELMQMDTKDMSGEEAALFYEKYIKSRKILCNEFVNEYAKPTFTDEEIEEW